MPVFFAIKRQETETREGRGEERGEIREEKGVRREERGERLIFCFSFSCLLAKFDRAR